MVEVLIVTILLLISVSMFLFFITDYKSYLGSCSENDKNNTKEEKMAKENSDSVSTEDILEKKDRIVDATFKELASGMIGLIVIIVVISVVILFASQYFKVFSAKMDGKAKRMEAEQARLVLVEQARAERDAAKLRAEAIKIVGQMAKDYPEYRKQEYIGAFAEALREGTISQIIYIPTESGIPILEANRLVSSSNKTNTNPSTN